MPIFGKPYGEEGEEKDTISRNFCQRLRPLSAYRVLQEKVSSQAQGLWWQGVQDNMADQLIEAAHRSVDSRKRLKAYSRCLSWLHENPHWLYLYHPMKLYAHRSEVSGIDMDHAGLVKLSATPSHNP